MSDFRRHAHTPTVTELRAVLAVAELGSASAAAEALSLTQSAVSRTIRTMEQRLGVRLFTRTQQRLVLSDVGRAMLPDIRDILERLDLSARMAMAYGGAENVLRLAALPTFTRKWLIPRLPALLRAHPSLRIDISPALEPVAFDRAGVDAAIQRLEMAGPGTEVIPICHERLIVVASPDLLGRSPLSPDELLRFPLIQQSTRPSLWSDWLSSVGADLFQQIPGPRFQHFDMVIDAAEVGLGVAILPDIFVADSLQSGRLVQPCPDTLGGKSPYALIAPKASSCAALAPFAEWLVTAAD
ncbi:LysR family transcriptional regulator, glycine cleavage system transcriptional activator [Paracoccus isoporae]|uniref:LysR family transcriptional regulator, glycine cleavage system transcriptional activator n=1 Tax=Paracoccus isoporae TaxID=591205 RepID=A0A1G7HIN2_9RHOB|nr:LysR substrate-binding domain-containing protein [Paracoccus isoporae]SDF00350.1 LysR family transcriptional regulator, glycine cleavage system transcriptional activator [Paracoccus isoporae]